MTAVERLAGLDDRTVLQVVSYLTQELREQLRAASRSVIRSEGEARHALAAFMVHAQQAPDEATALELMPADMGAAQARVVLELLLGDPAVTCKVEDLIINAPEDSQMGVELVVGSILLTGLLITWLQTKVDFSVKREGGVTSFHLEVLKPSTDSETLREIVRPLTAIFTKT